MKNAIGDAFPEPTFRYNPVDYAVYTVAVLADHEKEALKAMIREVVTEVVSEALKSMAEGKVKH